MLRTNRWFVAVLSAFLLLPTTILAADDKKAESAETKSEDSKSDKKAGSDKKANDKKSDDKGDKKADDKTKSEPAKPPATVKVKQDKFKTELSLDGIVESKNSAEVSFHAETWSDFVVHWAVPQGEKVKKGDKLIEFDPVKIDEQLRDIEAGKKLAELSLEQLSQEVRLLEQSMPLELRVAERAARLAESDLQQFLSEDRDLSKKRADFMVKMYGNFLDYQKEELKQLEKMYKADDLTEETEEIILKRTRDQVEQVEFMNEMAKIDREQLFKIQLPRREDSLKESVNRTALTLQRSRTTLPISLDKARLELERQKFERERAAERLARLQNDRKLMTITAPADGIVYYGQCQRGQWTSASSVAARLRQGGRVSDDEVIMTIVEPGNLIVRATVPEKDLWQVRRGMTGTAQPAGYDRTKLSASVDELNTVPNTDGKFLAAVLFDAAKLPDDMPPLAAGMSCSVKLTTYTKDDALTLPAKVVQTDKQDEDQRYVWLPGKDDKPERRNVTVGRRTADTVEIIDGLKAGDKVLREAPKEDDE
jgi:HlyD family secretion protein